MPLFGTSGIRRIFDSELIQLTLKVSLALGSRYHKVVIGRDTRTSGEALLFAVSGGLLASGANCFDAGMVTTPTLALATREFDLGIMITASHNPPQYNGLKLLNSDGSPFSAEQQKELEDDLAANHSFKTQWDKIGTRELYPFTMENHISRIVRNFSNKMGLRVVVDSGCGAAYDITPSLLKQLGCEVIPLNCYPNGIFPREAEPVEVNLGALKKQVIQSSAHLGIAHDGDADRMMAVDDLGRYISGDKLLAIFSLASGCKDIVTTLDASMSIEEMGFNVRRTKVGDPFVSEELKKGGSFGGETSGAWIFPSISLCPDGIYAAAKITSIAAEEKLSSLVDKIPSYPMLRGSINGLVPSMDSIEKELLSNFKATSIEHIDGLRVKLANCWLLIRPSGTEPKIRLTVEARTEQEVQNLYTQVAAIVSRCAKDYK